MAAVCKYYVPRRLFRFSLSEFGFYHRNRLPTTRISRLPFSNDVKFDRSSFRQGSFTLIAAGIGVGAVFGAGYSYYHSQKKTDSSAVQKKHIILPALPDVPISRRIISPTDSSNLQLVLFQYPTCPFCCKVRAFLDYYGFSYDVVEVDPVLRQQTKWTDYKKVPILLAKIDGGYQQLNDSSMITSVLASYLYDKDSNLKDIVNFYPIMQYADETGSQKMEIMNRYFLMYQGAIPTDSSKAKVLEERNWRMWVDDVLVHTLSPNVYRTKEEALQAFTWFSEVGEWDKLFPAWERGVIVYVGAFAMWIIGKRLKKRHHLKDDVRQSLYDECDYWMKTVKDKGTTFLGGNTPNLADLAVYGVLSSIEGCDAFTDLLNNTQIKRWYNPMKQAVESHKGHLEIVP